MLADETDYYALRFAGVAKLYGQEGLQRLRDAHVCVVGLGGVGSWSVEALARSGVGRLTLIDLDSICISNTNRQMHALTGTIGKSKAQVLQQRVLDINPDCDVDVRLDFVSPDTVGELLLVADADAAGGRTLGRYDCVLDAIDSMEDKCALLDACRRVRMPVVTVGAAGGRADPARVAVADLTRVDYDSLLFRVRKTLRQDFGFPRGTKRNIRGRKWGVAAVYSTEVPEAEALTASGEVGPRMGLGGCDGSFGTASFVTGVFGLMAAGVVAGLIAGAPATTHDVNDDDTDGAASGSEWRWTPHALRYLDRDPREVERRRLRVPGQQGGEGEGDEEDWQSVLDKARQKDWAAVEDLAVKYPDFLIPSYGIHPWWLREHLEEETRDAAAAAKEGGWQQRLVAQLERNRRAGVGECGLDRTRRKEVSLDEQEEAMMQHLEVAVRLQRHATLHCVGAFGRLLGALQRRPRSSSSGGGGGSGGGGNGGGGSGGGGSGSGGDGSARGSRTAARPPLILHSFNGDASMVPQLAAEGCYFSFSGRGINDARAAAAAAAGVQRCKQLELAVSVPLDRLLLESDAEGDPEARAVTDLVTTCAVIAERLGMTAEQLAATTTANARRAFQCEDEG
ncbi:hypothetical protein JKP88DRAFT_353179 [Tribonema minus]|uniref:THIF-type NAD/FAD binding fold domain-containing protein n=1 Tax=Tribonema minus TaxID=303371 RepID=A0A836CMW8_9STRA|nr:hypothetical protein JKP88DRAFT_353179 [Tribonema minus]